MSTQKSRKFDPQTFLFQTGLGRAHFQYRPKQVIFAQGDPADAVFYVQQGRARLAVVSKYGKEATLTN
jgi:CRP/FNR family transcriptional regulator, cyclic AMP receptor protein